MSIFKKIPEFKGLFKNPFFYFGLVSVFLLGTVSFNSGLLKVGYLKSTSAAFLNSAFAQADIAQTFLSQNSMLALEVPDFKTSEENSVFGISPTSVVSTKVLGDMFGVSLKDKKEISEYTVEPGDTIQSVAEQFDITLNTLLWANDLTKKSTLKTGQKLIILPVSGMLHTIKSGDSISEIAKIYKSKTEEIIAFNALSNEGDIYIGDILIVPDGVMPSKPLPSPSYTPLADNFFIFPIAGLITQGLHFSNAIDIANKCGTPVYAAASGTIQRASYGYNWGGGNYVTILHGSGIVTYYGHLMTISVKAGQKVDVGDKIGFVGGGKGMQGAGISTGCHLHFGVTGAKNPLAKYAVGANISYK